MSNPILIFFNANHFQLKIVVVQMIIQYLAFSHFNFIVQKQGRRLRCLSIRKIVVQRP